MACRAIKCPTFFLYFQVRKGHVEVFENGVFLIPPAHKRKQKEKTKSFTSSKV